MCMCVYVCTYDDADDDDDEDGGGDQHGNQMQIVKTS